MLGGEDALRWVVNLCLAGASVGCIYLAVSGWLILRYRSTESSKKPAPVPVSIVMPLCGSEPGLYQRLLALCDQDYPGKVEIVCGTLNPKDPVLDIVEQVKAARPDANIACYADPKTHGHSLKVSNLTNIMRHVHHDTLVMIDSDIEVAPDYLSQVIAELQQPGVGAVTCLYHGVDSGTPWSRLSAMSATIHFMPNVVGGLALGLARPCFGPTIAMSRDMLHRIGGITAFADHLFDDYAIGEAVRATGYSVSVASFAVGHVFQERTARALLASQLRQACTIKGIDPVGHFGSIITHPFALALIALALGGGGEAIALAVAALACRAGLWWCMQRRFGARANDYLLLPVRELLAFATYVASFFVATVTWRGQRYRLSDHTLIVGQASSPKSMADSR
jgi:ceramide glucosyltransferase